MVSPFSYAVLFCILPANIAAGLSSTGKLIRDVLVVPDGKIRVKTEFEEKPLMREVLRRTNVAVSSEGVIMKDEVERSMSKSATRHHTRAKQSLLELSVHSDRMSESAEARDKSLEKARAALANLGVNEKHQCSRSPGMLIIRVGPKVASRNLGHYDWHPLSTLVLDAGKRWTCFTLGDSTMELGTSFDIPVGSDHKVRVRLADMQWLKSHYRNAGKPPPACEKGDTTCKRKWNRLWQEFRRGVPVARLSALVKGLLFGPDVHLHGKEFEQYSRSLRRDLAGGHLERMSAISRVAAKPEWLRPVLTEIASSKTKDLKHYMKNVETSYCDFMELKLGEAHDVDLTIHVFSTMVPHCNTFSIHDHPGQFASTLVMGEHRNNIYVGEPHLATTLKDQAAMLQAAHFEREKLRYTAVGCDPEMTPQPDGSSRGPLHMPAHAGHTTTFSNDTDASKNWVITRLAECSADSPGDSHVFPAHWLHRPRLAPSVRHAMTAVVYDNDLDHYSLGNLGGNSYNGTLRKDPRKFRKALRQFISLLEDSQSVSLRRSLAQSAPIRPLRPVVEDGGIAKIKDPILGLTADDDWDDDDDSDDDDDDGDADGDDDDDDDDGEGLVEEGEDGDGDDDGGGDGGNDDDDDGDDGDNDDNDGDDDDD